MQIIETLQSHKHLLAGFFIAGLLMLSQIALAADTTANKNSTAANPGAALDETSATVLGATMWVIGGAAYVLQGVFTILLTVAGTLMDNAFIDGVNIPPSFMDVIHVGWTATRDMANAVLILLLLWIAFTIVFNLQNLGGTSMLVRLVMIALAINFSLVVVDVVFGFANRVAVIFYNKMDPDNTGVSQFIMQKIELQTMMNTLSKADLEKIQTNAQEAAVPPAQKTPPKTTTYAVPWKDELAAAAGIQTADASVAGVTGGAIGGCVLGGFAGSFVPVVGTGIGCLVGGASAALANAFGNFGQSVLSNGYKFALPMIAGALMLLATACAFFFAATALVMRFIMEILLSIAAPLAFLAYAVPGQQKWFSQWWGAVVSYAFFAPVFYFLMYITMFMMQQFASHYTGVPKASIDLGRMLELIIVLTMMYVAVKYARQTGGVIAEASVTGLKTAGTFALGATAMVGGVAAAQTVRRFAPQIEQTLQSIGAMPGIGKLTAPLTRSALNYVGNRGKKVGELEALYEKMGPAQLEHILNTSVNAEEKVAATKVAARKGKLNDFVTRNIIDPQKSLDLAGQFGPQHQEAILRGSPNLIDKKYFDSGKLTKASDALKAKGVSATDADALAAHGVVASGMKPADLVNIEAKSITKDFAKALLYHATPQHLSQMARDNLNGALAVIDILKKDKSIEVGMDKRTVDFLRSSPAAKTLGIDIT